MPRYTDIINHGFTFSPSILDKVSFKNRNAHKLGTLLSRDLKKIDNGLEIGSAAYMKESPYYFIKTKALTASYYTEMINDESAIPMNKKSYIDYSLKKGDILISKDSNIGECVILSKDMPNYMIGGALYKLPLKENKNYIFAFIKSEFFRRQLDCLVPKGATIRHAGKKFLECDIIFPNLDDDKNSFLINLVDSLVESIVLKETFMKEKDEEIYKIILNELYLNSNSETNEKLVASETTINDLFASLRLDAGYYTLKAKEQKSMLSNYKYGCSSLTDLGYSMKRGQNLQISNIGKSIYSDKLEDGFYTVIKPTNFNDYGTVEDYEFLGNKSKLQELKNGDIVFSGEGTVGKCVLFTKTKDKWITNIHGIVLQSEEKDIYLSSYISCILRFFRKWGYYEHFTVGGQGGSLGQKYWEEIVIPNFPKEVIKEIKERYHNLNVIEEINSIKEFKTRDCLWAKQVGVVELSQSIKKSQRLVNNLLEIIVNEKDFSKEEIFYQLNDLYK